jgi:hypothetical protein
MEEKRTIMIDGLAREPREIKGGPFKGQLATGMKHGDTWISVLGDHTGDWKNIKGKEIELVFVQGGQYPTAKIGSKFSRETTQGNSGVGTTTEEAKTPSRPDLRQYVAFLVEAQSAAAAIYPDIEPQSRLLIHIGIGFLDGKLTWDPADAMATPEDTEATFTDEPGGDDGIPF